MSTKRLLLLWILVYASSCVPIYMMASLDNNRMPDPKPSGLLGLILFVPMLLTAGWCVYRVCKASQQKELLGAVCLKCSFVFIAIFTLCALPIYLNKHLDRRATPMDMIVTDVFVVYRGKENYDAYVAVSLPPKAGGPAIWTIPDSSTPLSRYPIGSKARIIWHEGYFGLPWCEYVDKRFPQYQYRLNQYERSGRAIRAAGQFSPGSPYKAVMESWNIPVSEVTNLNTLPAEGKAD